MARNISDALKAEYAKGTTTIATCWKATLTDGTIVTSTTWPEKLTIDGDIYVPTQAYSPSDVVSDSDLSVDNLDVQGILAMSGADPVGPPSGAPIFGTLSMTPAQDTSAFPTVLMGYRQGLLGSLSGTLPTGTLTSFYDIQGDGAFQRTIITFAGTIPQNSFEAVTVVGPSLRRSRTSAEADFYQDVNGSHWQYPGINVFSLGSDFAHTVTFGAAAVAALDVGQAAMTTDDIRSGRWDYAAIELFEVNASDPTMGRNVIRAGTLGRVSAGNFAYTAELRGQTQKLSRRIVQLTTKECTANLGDSKCQIDLSTYRELGTITAVNLIDNLGLYADVFNAHETHYFTGGLITMTSGENDGLSMEIKVHSGNDAEGGGWVDLAESLPFAVVVGDTFTIVPGCQKRFIEDCKTKFDNAPNFRGFPYLPGVGVFGSGRLGLGSDGNVDPT